MSKEETNFYRLAILLFRIAPRAVKLVFDYEFPPLMLQQDLHRNRRKIDKLLNGSLIIQPQYDLLYPKGKVLCY